MAEMEVGGVKFSGFGKIGIAVTVLSTLAGSAYVGYEFYFDYLDLREVVQEIDIDEIKAFGQKDIYILKSELPSLESDEVYWFELEGMEIINLEGQHLGLVHEVSNFGANDVLVVKPAKKQLKNILIPFIKNRVIISIEKSKNSILVDWQEDY